MDISLFIELFRSESLNVVLLYIRNTQNAYKPKHNHKEEGKDPNIHTYYIKPHVTRGEKFNFWDQNSKQLI